jgi:hypothetical protein
MSSLGKPQSSTPLVAAPTFVSPDDNFGVVKVCNFIFAQVFSDTTEVTDGNCLATIGAPTLSMALALTRAVLSNSTKQESIDEGISELILESKTSCIFY